MVDYNKAITNVHYRKGSLLEYNGVYLAEGPWPAKAYFDATRLARARDAAQYMDYTFTQPRVVSRGPYRQMTGAACSVPMGRCAGSAVPTPSPETVPAPSPTGTPQASPSSLQPTPGSQTSILPSAAQGGTGGWSASAGRARSGQLPVAHRWRGRAGGRWHWRLVRQWWPAGTGRRAARGARQCRRWSGVVGGAAEQLSIGGRNQ